MTLPLRRWRSSRRAHVAIAAAAIVLIAVVTVLALSGRSATPDRSAGVDPGRAIAYREAIAPAMEGGGQLVAAAMRPGLKEIAGSDVSPPDLLVRARAWVVSMRGVRQQFDAVPVPAGLEKVHDGFDSALAGYVRVALDLRAASRAAGAERQRLVDEAASIGATADRAYDAADAALTLAAKKPADS